CPRSPSRRRPPHAPTQWRFPTPGSRAVAIRPAARSTPSGKHSYGATPRCSTLSAGSPDLSDQRLDRGHQFREALLRVGEIHAGLRIAVELVVDARVPGRHRALDHDDALRVVDVEDRHAGHRIT